MKKNMQIEGLRGLACLMIVLFHIFYQYNVFCLGQDGPWLLKHWGEFGVGVFIFISGYYLIDFEKEQFSFLNFLKKRLLRLYPIYAVAVILIFVIRSFTQVSGFTAVTWKDHLLNLTLLNGYVDKPYIEPAHWYMTTLLRTIILAGVLQKYKLHKRTEVMGGLLCLIVALKVIQRITENVWVLLICRLILMFTGGAYTGVFVLAFMMRKLADCDNLKALWSEHKKELFVIALTIVYLIGLPGIIYTGIALCSGLVVYLCLYNKLPFLENKLFLAVSKISFAWYLIHQYVAYWVEETLGGGEQSLLPAIAAFIITGLMAVVLHNYVEKPLGKINRLCCQR